MNDKEELFASAKEAILGPCPDGGEDRIAYNMAEILLKPTIRDAEYILSRRDGSVSDISLSLRLAASFHKDPAFDGFSKRTRAALENYASNFSARYAPLIQELKAA